MTDPLIDLGLSYPDAVLIRLLRRRPHDTREATARRQTIRRLQHDYPHISIPALINGRCSHDNASE